MRALGGMHWGQGQLKMGVLRGLLVLSALLGLAAAFSASEKQKKQVAPNSFVTEPQTKPMAWFTQGATPLGEVPSADGNAGEVGNKGITTSEIEKWEREREQALREADSALKTGNATMSTLADQQETLDRAELIAESNEYMLAKSRRTLRGENQGVHAERGGRKAGSET